jgi:hypothetical protein
MTAQPTNCPYCGIEPGEAHQVECNRPERPTRTVEWSATALTFLRNGQIAALYFVPSPVSDGDRVSPIYQRYIADWIERGVWPLAACGV